MFSFGFYVTMFFKGLSLSPSETFCLCLFLLKMLFFSFPEKLQFRGGHSVELGSVPLLALFQPADDHGRLGWGGAG